MSEVQNIETTSTKSKRGGNRIYTDADKQMVRDRYNNGQSVALISEKTGIHEATIYKYCADLVKAANRRSTGRPPKIKMETVIAGLKHKLTQAQIAERAGTSRQAVCLFIKRHKEHIDQVMTEYNNAEKFQAPEVPPYRVNDRHDQKRFLYGDSL